MLGQHADMHTWILQHSLSPLHAQDGREQACCGSQKTPLHAHSIYSCSYIEDSTIRNKVYWQVSLLSRGHAHLVPLYRTRKRYSDCVCMPGASRHYHYPRIICTLLPVCVTCTSYPHMGLCVLLHDLVAVQFHT